MRKIVAHRLPPRGTLSKGAPATAPKLNRSAHSHREDLVKCSVSTSMPVASSSASPCSRWEPPFCWPSGYSRTGQPDPPPQHFPHAQPQTPSSGNYGVPAPHPAGDANREMLPHLPRSRSLRTAGEDAPVVNGCHRDAVFIFPTRLKKMATYKTRGQCCRVSTGWGGRITQQGRHARADMLNKALNTPALPRRATVADVYTPELDQSHSSALTLR